MADKPLIEQAIYLLREGYEDQVAPTALLAIAEELRTANLIALAAVHFSREDHVLGDPALVAACKRLGLPARSG